ncbi:MAG: ABC transporter permease subunit [SAR202 cluster bacterium]|nr:ABC transporter permease subunit [SAR202 cluster bacterium]|tara:strand:+ start:2083 stop:3030 length:948 start_codon:yes stop_codon:yes gene_type:complete
MRLVKKFRRPLILLSTIVGALVASIIINSITGEKELGYPTNIGPEISGAIDDFIGWLVVNGEWFFDGINDNIKIVLDKLRDFLTWIPWPVMIALIFILGWRLGTVQIGLASAIGMILIGLVNLWDPAMVTIAIMVVSVSLAIILGIPIGILMARSNLIETILRPILDAMQTMPSFVYLVPGIMLFGLGNVAAILATVLYSIPPCIRLTSLGIRQVNPSVVEAGESFGSTNFQLLSKVQLPMAVPTIMAGVNQTIMMALAMSTIAAMVGAGGLGLEVLRSMGQLEEGQSFIAGSAIVIMAIIIDRITQKVVKSGSN